MPKLTLSAKQDVIEKAKRLADERGTSVSAMFSRFVESATANGDPKHLPLGPTTRKAIGLVKLPTGKSDRQLIEEAMSQRYGK